MQMIARQAYGLRAIMDSADSRNADQTINVNLAFTIYL
jgi:hypothetical protein